MATNLTCVCMHIKGNKAYDTDVISLIYIKVLRYSYITLTDKN